MTTINVTIQDKIAAAEGSPTIICGNSDYTVKFTFDSEWNAYAAKTVRFRFYQNGMALHYDILFTGDTVNVPVLHDVYEVEIGVYAGNLHTTTDARVPCVRSITDGDAVHEDPPADLYEQLMELLSHMSGGGGACGSAAIMSGGTADMEAGPAEVVYPEFPARLDLINAAWITYVGETAYLQSRTNRVTMPIPCTLPAGKTLTAACQTASIKMTAAAMNTGLVVSENISWTDSPLTLTNNGETDVYVVVGLKKSDDSDFTPGAVSVTASVD